MTTMHGTITQNSNNSKRGLASYLHYAAFPLGAILLITTAAFVFVLSTPQTDMVVEPSKSHQNQNNLRRSSGSNLSPEFDMLHGIENEFLAPLKENLLLPSLWNDEFLSPLMEIDPLFRQRQETHSAMWHDLAFDLTQNEDFISLTTSIPDVPLKDINIEVIDGTVLHIHGDKHRSSSQVIFDKRFALGHHLEESSIKAKLTKGGELIVIVPKVGKSMRIEVRKIPIMEEL